MAYPTQTTFQTEQVKEVFDDYPSPQRAALLQLRQLLLETASTLRLLDVEETLKWGEPSYLTKNGSTIRLAWRKKYPDQFAIFFNCNTLLVETFKEIYPNEFHYEGNRAITFTLEDSIPTKAIQHCFELALTYKQVKHLPLLGV